MNTATIRHNPPRVIDGSGRMTPGIFAAEVGCHKFEVTYSASALDEGRDGVLTSQDAHARCMDWISDMMGFSDAE